MTLLLLLTWCLNAAAQAEAPAYQACLVVSISDGDTLIARCDGPRGPMQVKVRLSAIDAPERDQPFSARAREALAALTFQRPVELYCRKTDRYGRSVCRVMVAPATQAGGPATLDAGLALVTIGMAWWYRDFAREQTAEERGRYESAEDEARRRRIGLWSHGDAIAPWQWRRARSLPRAAGTVTPTVRPVRPGGPTVG